MGKPKTLKMAEVFFGGKLPKILKYA